MKTVIEPFRTKVVEPIRFTSRQERQDILKAAGYNLFQVPAADTIIDFLTDSGTSAMSTQQWSALMQADESYAGCSSFYRFEKTIKELFGFTYVIPVHQGRAAERLLFGQLVKEGNLVPSNTHFDTTRANIEVRKGVAIDLPCDQSKDSQGHHLFKGNINLEALEDLLSAEGHRVPIVMMTVTNNAVGGQPVSLENLKSASEICRRFGKMLFIDAARFAENAYLIQQRETSYRQSAVRTIVREMFSLADGCLMSAKKDGLSNMGGFLALRNEELTAAIKDDLIISEGFTTYGGLSGRDLESVAGGLWEATDEDYLRYRLASAGYLARGLTLSGVPIVSPAGLHAIYVDARRMLPHVDPSLLPGQALACELYIEAGIRSCEIGTVMFGRTRSDGTQDPARQDLVRLALPRRVYSQSHYDYVIEAAQLVLARSKNIHGMQITREPRHLRHFTAVFKRVPAACASPRA